MKCPVCHGATKVTNSRSADQGMAIKRRRECEKCGQRFSTYERMSLVDLRVLKRSGVHEAYDRHKIERGLRKALEKRSISEEKFQRLGFAIEHDVLNLKQNLISSEQIGRIVLLHLRKIDKVAYIRFASNYRNFKSTKAFEREIQKLEKIK